MSPLHIPSPPEDKLIPSPNFIFNILHSKTHVECLEKLERAEINWERSQDKINLFIDWIQRKLIQFKANKSETTHENEEEDIDASEHEKRKEDVTLVDQTWEYVSIRHSSSAGLLFLLIPFLTQSVCC